jgi:hypothetical protein
MKLVTHPLIVNGVFFLQPVDNALADITEGSDIVGKYFEVDGHSISSYKYLTTFLFNFKVISGHRLPDQVEDKLCRCDDIEKEGLKYFIERRKNNSKIMRQENVECVMR